MSTSFEDLRTLQLAEQIADSVWLQVQNWKPFEKRVVGEQLARASDSIGANIAEAYGRFHYGDKLKFLYYSRGSLFETKYWINRAAKRQLISNDQSSDFAKQLTELAIQINAFAKSLREQRQDPVNKLKEDAGSCANSDENNIFTAEEINTISILESQISTLGAP